MAFAFDPVDPKSLTEAYANGLARAGVMPEPTAIRLAAICAAKHQHDPAGALHELVKAAQERTGDAPDAPTLQRRLGLDPKDIDHQGRSLDALDPGVTARRVVEILAADRNRAVCRGEAQREPNGFELARTNLEWFRRAGWLRHRLDLDALARRWAGKNVVQMARQLELAHIARELAPNGNAPSIDWPAVNEAARQDESRARDAIANEPAFASQIRSQAGRF